MVGTSPLPPRDLPQEAPPPASTRSPSSSLEFSLEGDEGISYLTDSSPSLSPHPLLPPTSPTALFYHNNNRNTSCRSPGLRSKIFNDMVHPHLELPQLCYRLINTPQFQRLRNLKQLGLCYHVYPSACHNRFEHCIGTSYLAGKYCKILGQNQPELDINHVDILCLYVAGLCHDLGHGPFSHTWEHFMHNHFKNYSHEEMSIRMLDYLLEDNNLWRLFEEEGLTPRDLVFIKELILGRPVQKGDTQFRGRGPNKHFLYQIVANDKTKIDVDKFDYILRDCKNLQVSTSFDYERVLNNSRVVYLQSPGQHQVATQVTPDTHTTIVYRKKISDNLEDLFKGRYSLHQKAYQHKVTKIIEEMVLDGLEMAELDFTVKGKDGKMLSLSGAHQDISAFMKLTDCVFEQVVNWENGGHRARRIFNDILTRNLYKCLGYINPPFDGELRTDLEKLGSSVVLIRTQINYGKGGENPLNSALFYEKNRPEILFTLEFPDPKVETKLYIVLRPLYACQDSNIDTTAQEEIDNMRNSEAEVEEILKRHSVVLQSE